MWCSGVAPWESGKKKKTQTAEINSSLVFVWSLFYPSTQESLPWKCFVMRLIRETIKWMLIWGRIVFYRRLCCAVKVKSLTDWVAEWAVAAGRVAAWTHRLIQKVLHRILTDCECWSSFPGFQRTSEIKRTSRSVREREMAEGRGCGERVVKDGGRKRDREVMTFLWQGCGVIFWVLSLIQLLGVGGSRAKPNGSHNPAFWKDS